MLISEITEIEQVWIFKKESLAGTLKRTSSGSEFQYLDSYLEKEDSKPLSFSMPLRSESYKTNGFNLNPFFAGLLPEGMRLTALISSLKTSSDDMFSILAAAGTNLIGDISISLDKSHPKNQDLNIPSLEEVDFDELFKSSITQKNYLKKQADFSISGVQNKISSQMISFPVDIASKKKSYILKLQPVEFPNLINNEHFFMKLASICGIEAPETKIIYDKNNTPALLVERFDRTWNKKTKTLEKLHQEDACQFLEKYPADKYRLSSREIAESIKHLSTAPLIENTKLLKLILFSYLICNGDLHAKNISLQIKDKNRVKLSPAYDLLSTLPYGDEHLALSFEGKKKNLMRKEFINWSQRLEINEKVVDRIIQEMTSGIQSSLEELGEISFSKKKTDFLKTTILNRINEL